MAQKGKQEDNGNATFEIAWEAPPKVTRERQADGVWVERLAPLRENPDAWARVYGPVKNPHPTVNMIRRSLGDEDENYDIVGRKVDVDGEEQGFVYARFMSEETKAEVLPKRNERARKMREARAKTKAEKEAEGADA